METVVGYDGTFWLHCPRISTRALHVTCIIRSAKKCGCNGKHCVCNHFTSISIIWSILYAKFCVHFELHTCVQFSFCGAMSYWTPGELDWYTKYWYKRRAVVSARNANTLWTRWLHLKMFYPRKSLKYLAFWCQTWNVKQYWVCKCNSCKI